MTPAEAKKFQEECKRRAEENARKWHSDPEVRKRTRKAAQASCSMIRDKEND